MSTPHVLIGLLITTAVAGAVAFWALVQVRAVVALPVTRRVPATQRYTTVAFYALIVALLAGATTVAVWA